MCDDNYSTRSIDCLIYGDIFMVKEKDYVDAS